MEERSRYKKVQKEQKCEVDWTWKGKKIPESPKEDV